MQEVQKTEKRKDTRGRVLRTGESQRPDGSYQFRWSEGGERRTRYAPTLEALRQKEDEIARQRLLGRLSTGGSATVGQLVERHMLLRPNLRERTRRSYRNTIAHLQPDDDADGHQSYGPSPMAAIEQQSIDDVKLQHQTKEPVRTRAWHQ